MKMRFRRSLHKLNAHRNSCEPAIAATRGLFAVALCFAAGAAMTVVGCSGGAEQTMHGDTASAQVSSNKPSPRLSPEQCLAGGEIQEAASRPDNEGYVIQPGDILSVDFYLS